MKDVKCIHKVRQITKVKIKTNTERYETSKEVRSSCQ